MGLPVLLDHPGMDFYVARIAQGDHVISLVPAAVTYRSNVVPYARQLVTDVTLTIPRHWKNPHLVRVKPLSTLPHFFVGKRKAIP